MADRRVETDRHGEMTDNRAVWCRMRTSLNRRWQFIALALNTYSEAGCQLSSVSQSVSGQTSSWRSRLNVCDNSILLVGVELPLWQRQENAVQGAVAIWSDCQYVTVAKIDGVGSRTTTYVRDTSRLRIILAHYDVGLSATHRAVGYGWPTWPPSCAVTTMLHSRRFWYSIFLCRQQQSLSYLHDWDRKQ